MLLLLFLLLRRMSWAFQMHERWRFRPKENLIVICFFFFFFFHANPFINIFLVWRRRRRRRLIIIVRALGCHPGLSLDRGYWPEPASSSDSVRQGARRP